VIFDLARETNTLRSLKEISGRADTQVPLRGPDYQPPPSQEDVDRRRRSLVHLLGVLGIDLQAASAQQQPSIEPYINLLLEMRRKLRDIKQWALADEVRDRLGALGVTVEDKPGGASTWRLEH